jgi:hypothetical protein
MNEQIFKLALKAMDFQGAVDTDTELKMTNDELAKFAELIVRKCIKDCRDMFVVDSVSWNLLNEKLEHFGVEE